MPASVSPPQVWTLTSQYSDAEPVLVGVFDSEAEALRHVDSTDVDLEYSLYSSRVNSTQVDLLEQDMAAAYRVRPAEADETGWVVLRKAGAACSWCDKAEKLLLDNSVTYRHEDCEGLADLRDHLRARGHHAAARAVTTFPQILHGDRFVGGFAQLAEHLDEPLLRSAVESTRRFTPFPIQHHDMWDMYRRAVASFWTPEEVDLSRDVDDWKARLTDDERHFVKHVLAFFAGSDGIVMENLDNNFGREVQQAEARCFYAYQTFNESVHANQYGLLIDTLVEDAGERDRLFRAIETLPAVRKKARWAMKWLNPTRTFAERLLAFCCVEGILFSGSFCAVFWLKQRGLMPGLGLSNQFISRDEGLHQDFGSLMYSHLRHKLSAEAAVAIVREAVENEKEFIVDAIPCRLIGMNSDLMSRYIEFVADRLLEGMGYPATYGASNPFPWMQLLSLSGKDNFFERFSSEYQKAGVMATAADQAFGLDDAF